MSNTGLYRPNVFLGLAYPEAFVDPFNPTDAELNGPLVIDITCALDEDGTEFTLGDSETDDTLTFCTGAGTIDPTTKNATVTYKALRDEDRIATGVFNLAFDHLAFADVPYFAIERIGYGNTVDFATGQVVRLVQVATDQPVDNLAVDTNASLTNSMLTQNVIAWNVEVA